MGTWNAVHRQWHCWFLPIVNDHRKPVEIPSVLLLFCSIDKVEGRKIYISGTLTEPLVDEPSGLPSTDARVYTEATALFLALKEHE